MNASIKHSRPWIAAPELVAVDAVARSGMFLDGTTVEAFRRELQDFSGGDVSLMPSGRYALAAALRALGLAAGAEVIVQSYVCDAALWAIREAGFVPMLCDIGPAWACTPETVAPRVTRRTGALMLTPVFGIAPDVASFRRFRLPIVNDLCQAPMTARPAAAPDRGDVLVLSFHPTKYLCGGGGGAAIAADTGVSRALAEAERQVSIYAPFGELQAALALAQLRRIGEIASRRAAIGDEYFRSLPHRLTRTLRAQAGTEMGSLFRFPLRTAGYDFDAVAREFLVHGMVVRRGVDALLHRILDRSDAEFPGACRAFAETISIPFYPALKEGERRAVLSAVGEVMGAGDAD